jgi:OPA family glycerol-3-phosphate transporter-like MFS transporter/OPA family sugar phosphate sensor protein UhpC-like MFS transporter
MMHEAAGEKAQYRLWRRRVMFWSIVGYASFYLVRKNLAIAMPVMESQLGLHKKDLGLFLTLHGLLYGVSKFANGVVGDRVNASRFMAFGLVACALLNVGFGLSGTVVVLGVIWMANGWFQGIGFPPCARLMTHWYRPEELATKMSVWNTSHSIGTGGVLILCGYLVKHFGDWRLCFFVPAALAVVVAVLLLVMLPDTRGEEGRPSRGAGDGQAGVFESDDLGFCGREFFCLRGAVCGARLGADVAEGDARGRDPAYGLDGGRF